MICRNRIERFRKSEGGERGTEVLEREKKVSDIFISLFEIGGSGGLKLETKKRIKKSFSSQYLKIFQFQPLYFR